MQVFGLTGGIASGKSTVTAILRRLGAHVIDADVIAREVVRPGTPGLAAVGARFPGVLTAEGELNRQELGRRIFADPVERAALDAILHPLIAESFAAQVQALAAKGVRQVIYDSPLLIETRQHILMSGVIVVWVLRAVQKARLMARNHLTEEEAEQRLLSQLPLDSKRSAATWIVDNSGLPEDTQAQVETIWRHILDSEDRQ